MAELNKREEVVGFIGAGNMAGALIRGLVGAGFPGNQVLVADLDGAKTTALGQELGVRAVTSAELVETAQVVVLAVKPGGIVQVCEEHSSRSSGKLWISVAAGVESATIESALGEDARVIRAMPNTPALVGKGATALCSGARATDDDLALAQELLGAAGITEVVAESMMDAVTGLSGSGPAFIMLVIESMTDGAVRAGLPRPIAQKLAAQTVLGAATLLQETGMHPGELKDMVTSPGGTTIAGIEALEASGLRTSLISGVTAAAERSRKLSGK